jgi:hypothetical protein
MIIIIIILIFSDDYYSRNIIKCFDAYDISEIPSRRISDNDDDDNQ